MRSVQARPLRVPPTSACRCEDRAGRGCWPGREEAAQRGDCSPGSRTPSARRQVRAPPSTARTMFRRRGWNRALGEGGGGVRRAVDPLRTPTPVGISRAGSWARIACWSRCRASLGSIPSSSTSVVACVLVGVEGLGLSVGAIQGEHLLGARAFSKRVLADEPLSSPISCSCRPSARSQSIRSMSTVRRSSSSCSISSRPTDSSSSPASVRPRHSARACLEQLGRCCRSSRRRRSRVHV